MPPCCASAVHSSSVLLSVVPSSSFVPRCTSSTRHRHCRSLRATQQHSNGAADTTDELQQRQPQQQPQQAQQQQQQQQLRPQQQQQQQLQQQQQQQPQAAAMQPAVWCQGILTGSFSAEAAAVLPPVTWQPADLIKVVTYALPAAGLAVGINSQLRQWLLTNGTSAETAQLAAANAAADASIQQLAHLHLAQEAVLALLLTAAVRVALGPRVTAAAVSPYWAAQTLGTCLLLFPLVDPLLSLLWQPVAEAVLGPAPINPLVETVQQAGASGQTGALAEHCVASGLLGPLWEEVFWRGFFLTALTKVLPIPACIALSALNFAALHLSAANFLPLLVLGGTCDALYLRSGGNLLAPLLLHGLWNSSQVLQIALLHKDTFV